MLASGLLFAPPALGTLLPPARRTRSRKPRSRAADGNQAQCCRPLIDWQGLQSAEAASSTTADANDQDSAFEGGSKEDDAGPVGLHGRVGRRQPRQGQHPRRLVRERPGWSGHVRLSRVLADPQESGGTTFLTFELNHDARLWNNGKAMIPCRRTGDILVSYEPQGNRVEVVLQRWVTAATDLATRVRHQRPPRRSDRPDAERRRTRRHQRSGDHELASGVLRQTQCRVSSSARRP